MNFADITTRITKLKLVRSAAQPSNLKHLRVHLYIIIMHRVLLGSTVDSYSTRLRYYVFSCPKKKNELKFMINRT